MEKADRCEGPEAGFTRLGDALASSPPSPRRAKGLALPLTGAREQGPAQVLKSSLARNTGISCRKSQPEGETPQEIEAMALDANQAEKEVIDEEEVMEEINSEAAA